MSAESVWEPAQETVRAAGGLSAVYGARGLPQVFTPAEAARLLRDAGLTELTECALRTRAYRKQIPFHLNGRRIVFTLSDLREITEGGAYRPQPQARAATPPAASSPTPRRRPSSRRIPATADPWRARSPHDSHASPKKGQRR
jgi:hypothetical protein